MNSEAQIKNLLDALNSKPYENETKAEILRQELSTFLFGKERNNNNDSMNSLALTIEKMHTQQFIDTYNMIHEGDLPIVFYKQVTKVDQNGCEFIDKAPKTKEELEAEHEFLLLQQFESILQMNRRQLIKKEPIEFNPATYGMAMALINGMLPIWIKTPEKYETFYRLMRDYIQLVKFNTIKSEEYQGERIHRR